MASNRIQTRDRSPQDVSTLMDMVQTDLICRYLPDTTLTFANEAYCKYFGKKMKDLIGTSFLTLLPENAREAARNHVRSLCEDRQPVHYEHPVIGPEGEIRWQQWIDLVISDEQGQVHELQAIGRDITERKLTEDELSRSRNLFQRIAETMPDILYLYDLVERRNIYANAGLTKVLGYSPEEIQAMGERMLETIIHPGDYWKVIEYHKQFQRLQEGQIALMEYRARHVNGDYRWLRSRDMLFERNSGEVARLILGVAQDVTGQKEAEESLRKTQRELARVTRASTMGELVGSIAHEISQPLTAIVSNASACNRWLEDGGGNLDEVREAVSEIIRDGNRAGQIITRIHTLLKKAPVQAVHFNINEAITEVLSLTRSELERSRVLMIGQLAGNLPPVLGDKVELQQVILNLIVNSIEAMQSVEDRPHVITVLSQHLPSGEILISVRDNGIGVDLEEATKLFEPFFTTKPQGMGIGLSISSSIVQAHGGKMGVLRNPDYGMTFSFTLPSEKHSQG